MSAAEHVEWCKLVALDGEDLIGDSRGQNRSDNHNCTRVDCWFWVVSIYGWEITKAWTKTCPAPKPAPSQSNNVQVEPANADSVAGQAEDINDPYSYVATILIGLVGGVFAVLFGQKINLAATGWKEILTGLYAIAYTLMGVASVVTWMFRPCESVLVKTLALSFLGLLVPIVTGFFKNNSFSEVMGWKKTEAGRAGSIFYKTPRLSY